MARTGYRVPLSARDARRIADLVHQHGAIRVAEMLGVTEPTIGRLAGGLNVMPATRFMVLQRLAEIEQGAAA